MPHRYRRRRLLMGGAAVLVLALGAWLVLRPDAASERPEAGSGPVTGAPTTDTARSEPERKRERQRKRAVKRASGLPSGELPAADLPGLPGRTLRASLPPLDLRITLTSRSPIGIVGWTIPTSRDRASGQTTVSGGSWSLSTVVYGRPDYARVFVQAGATGDPITCTIAVEGRVTERRATAGPYGRLMCQG